MIRCWPVFKIGNKPAHHAIKHARPIRHVRRVRRAVAIVCVSVGSTGAAALISPLFYWPGAAPHEVSGGSGEYRAPAIEYRAPISGAAAQPVPEPGSLALLATGVALLAIARGEA